jgi:DNA-binding NarL/FixJ family response regulator
MKTNAFVPELQNGGKPPFRVFVVDDHPIFAQVFSELLNQSGDFVVVGSAGDGQTALAMLRELKVDVLLLDLMLPGISGLEVLGQLRQERSAVRTVVYSGMASDESIAAAFAFGACAVVEKSAEVNELFRALRTVAGGGFPLNSRMSGVLRTVVRQQTAGKELGQPDLLILRRLALRNTVKEIAQELRLSASAVYKARKRIMHRMGLTERGGFLGAATRLGLIAAAGEVAAPRAGTRGRRNRGESAP